MFGDEFVADRVASGPVAWGLMTRHSAGLSIIMCSFASCSVAGVFGLTVQVLRQGLPWLSSMGVALDEQAVLRPINIQVEPEVQKMVVMDSQRVGGDQATVCHVTGIRVVRDIAALDCLYLFNPTRAEYHGDRAILTEHPVEEVIIVAHRRNESYHELSLLTAFILAIDHLIVPPRNIPGGALKRHAARRWV